ncbi:MAG: hypothetical protein K0Q87_3451 [Neobacillus sp.]|jgi:hypothetical protein|nr:hypothetical protein [Neobacillus sp.]
MRKFLLAFSLLSILFTTGFDKTAESEITLTIYSMISSMNRKDPESYIKTLSDYFIKETYGDREFIKKNMIDFGQITEIEFQIKQISTANAFIDYKLLHLGSNREQTIFYGKMILIKTKAGWKIHSASEKMIS